MNILYVNACVREESRTAILADTLLNKLGEYTEITLEQENLKPLDRETLIRRTEMIEKGDYSSPMFDYAKQFAEADVIVVAAPFWDLSFPALLRIYLEQIYVTGIVSKYNEKGIPEGLCRAQKLYYVTTAGGPYDPKYSYEYLADMSTKCFGIPETELIFAEMLDVDGVHPEQILRDAAEKI